MTDTNQKIKVCHVLECGALGGCGRMVASICEGLSSDRLDVALVYGLRPETTPHTFESIFPRHVLKVFVPEMVRRISFVRDLRAFWKLYRFFKSYKPDVVHAHSSKAGFLARFAAWASRVPRIFYSAHGYSFRMTDVSAPSRCLYFLAEFLASRIGTTVANGPSEEIWARRLAGACRVLPYYNGIDIKLFVPSYANHDAAKLTVATCGRLTSAKDPRAFIAITAQLAQEFPTARFLWIGGGNEEESQAFMADVERAGLKDRVHMTGWQTRDVAHKYLASADVVLHYSTWDILPTAVLEAMALGKPVVGSTAVDQIVHGVTGFVAKNVHEATAHIRNLLNSWELRFSLGTEARKLIEQQYSINRLIAQLEAAYLGVGIREEARASTRNAMPEC